MTDGGELAALLALGITPVGFGARNDPLDPWTADAGADDPAILRYDLSNAGEVDFETMAAWRSDLIVGQLGFVTEDTIGTYDAIAPTVATQSVSWRASLRQVATATGREAGARQVSDAIVAQTMELAAELGGLGGLRIGWVVPVEDQWFEYLDTSTVGMIFAELGLQPLPAAPAQTAGTAVVDVREVSPERIGDIDADALMVFANSDGSTRVLAETNPLWETLPAVRAGRVAFLDRDVSNAASRGTVLSVPYLLDALGRILPPLATGTGG